jgi:acylglycerol lipase
MIKNEEMFEGPGGLKLNLRTWLPDGPARAVMVIIHGFKAHSGLYEWPAQQLVREGIAVYAMDLRGNGKSEGEPFWVENFSDYMGDLDRLFALVRTREPSQPLFLLGHSAGGVISCAYALEHQNDLAGFICEAFAYEVPVPKFALTLLKGLSYFAPHAGVLNLKDEGFSRDPAFVERMKADPLVAHGAGPAHTVAEMARANDRLTETFARMEMPILIMHGTKDSVTLPHGSQMFFDSASSVDKTLKLYEGHYHDLFNDDAREVVMADLLEWTNARAALPKPVASSTAAGERSPRTATTS